MQLFLPYKNIPAASKLSLASFSELVYGETHVQHCSSVLKLWSCLILSRVRTPPSFLVWEQISRVSSNSRNRLSLAPNLPLPRLLRVNPAHQRETRAAIGHVGRAMTARRSFVTL